MALRRDEGDLRREGRLTFRFHFDTFLCDRHRRVRHRSDANPAVVAEERWRRAFQMCARPHASHRGALFRPDTLRLRTCERFSPRTLSVDLFYLC